MRILIIGTGYVGLVTAACLAEKGHQVKGLDIDNCKINALKQGIIPIYEPGLEDLVKKHLHLGHLSFTTSYPEAAAFADIAFISTPTPSLPDGSADLSSIFDSAESLAACIDKKTLMIIKSTVPPGTAEKVKLHLDNFFSKKEKKIPFEILSSPEFLREGSAVHDCLFPDRIIVGHSSSDSISTIKELYTPCLSDPSKLLLMDLASAEMTKYAANAMLACRISFMNELSGLCEKLGANIENVRVGIGSDLRIGPQFLFAGIGFGGSCFPKDIRALKAKAEEVGYATPILKAVETINENQKRVLISKIERYFSKKGGIKDKTIAIWGLSFKPNTDDIREAPSLILIKELINLGAKVKIHDPVAMDHGRRLFSSLDLDFCESPYEASKNAEAIALVTEWPCFVEADLQKTLSLMNGQGFFDGRNQYEPQTMARLGFDYFGIGI